MPFSVSCACGRSLRVKDEFVGKKVRCPVCSNVLVVPRAEPEDEEERISDVVPVERTRRRPPPRPAPSEDEYDDDDEDEAAATRGRRLSQDYEDRRPPRRRPRRTRQRDRASRDGWFGNINAGLVGGVAMILIAVVWFVVGLMAGYIFFYPPILLVIGIIAMVKGLMGDR